METLYKRTKTGAIQQWYVSIQKNGEWMTHSGQLGGVVTDHKKTAKPKNVGKKNATTALEQATFDAESEWRSKKDEGYKTLTDLGFKNLVDDPNVIRIRLEKFLPQFNSDALGNVKPMLAPSKPWKAGDKKNKYPKIMEPKLDGVRSTIVINKVGEAVAVTILSRSGKEYVTLKHLAIKILDAKAKFPEGTTILDGEVYKHGWTLGEIGRAVKKYREGITEQLEFWVYDVPTVKGFQDVRSASAREYAHGIGYPFVLIDQRVVDNDSEVQVKHDSLVSTGFEGGMLKEFCGTYQPGQRSSFWQKVKMFDEDEYEIIGYRLGERGAEDLNFICKSPKGSTSKLSFEVHMKGSRESKKDMWDNMSSILGKMLTVKHFGFTDYGIPNLPIGKAIRDYE